jgi:hypothetical protein
MKLKDKKTHQPMTIKLVITDCECMNEHEVDTLYGEPITLETLNKYCEDYEEPKQSALRFMILTLTNFIENEPSDNVDLEDCKQMLEKLKAWERLEDKGFKFEGWEDSPAEDDFDMIWFTMKAKVWDVETQEALSLLFGGEE